jgi:hypothetical protein
MRLSLNLLAPFFLLKTFASATEYNFWITWNARDSVGTCTALMADTVSTKVSVAANVYLSTGGLPQVPNWNRGERHGSGRGLRAPDRELTCTALDLSVCGHPICKRSNTCYDSFSCRDCGFRRKGRQLYHVERTLDAAEIETLQNGLIGACQETLDKEVSRSGNFYSTSCKAALAEQLCDAVVTEVV